MAIGVPFLQQVRILAGPIRLFPPWWDCLGLLLAEHQVCNQSLSQLFSTMDLELFSTMDLVLLALCSLWLVHLWRIQHHHLLSLLTFTCFLLQAQACGPDSQASSSKSNHPLPHIGTWQKNAVSDELYMLFLKEFQAFWLLHHLLLLRRWSQVVTMSKIWNL